MKKQNLSEDLTPRELAISRQLFNQYKNESNKFIEDYGAEAENVARGRSIKLAKNMASKESKQRIKEMIKTVLSTKPQPVEEIIDSTEYIKNRKAVTEQNPTDTVTMDIPLLIRMLEFAKEDAKTDIELHSATEKMIALSTEGRVLNMGDYDSIVKTQQNE